MRWHVGRVVTPSLPRSTDPMVSPLSNTTRGQVETSLLSTSEGRNGRLGTGLTFQPPPGAPRGACGWRDSGLARPAGDPEQAPRGRWTGVPRGKAASSLQPPSLCQAGRGQGGGPLWTLPRCRAPRGPAPGQPARAAQSPNSHTAFCCFVLMLDLQPLTLVSELEKMTFKRFLLGGAATPVTPANQEAEAGVLQAPGQPQTSARLSQNTEIEGPGMRRSGRGPGLSPQSHPRKTRLRDRQNLAHWAAGPGPASGGSAPPATARCSLRQ